LGLRGKRSATYSELGERIEQLLGLAQEQAETLLADARAEAERIVTEARQDADKIRAHAQENGEGVPRCSCRRQVKTDQCAATEY
jgi:cell division septum initiation protein DivIVA